MSHNPQGPPEGGGWQGPPQQPYPPPGWRQPYGQPQQQWGQQPGYWTQPQWAKPRIESSLLRPRLRWYWSTAIPLILGLGLMAFLIVVAVRTFPDRPHPFLAPGGRTLSLDKGEDQTIYRQTRGAVFESSGTPRCVVRNARTKDVVPLHTAGSTTLSYSGDEYRTELNFDPPADGAYQVTCDPAGGVDHQALAVGERPRLGRFAAVVVGAIASGGLGALIAIAIVVLVAVRRSRHKRRLQDEAMAAQAGGPQHAAG